MNLKKITYIVLFTLLGFLIGVLFHGVIEIFYIKLLVRDFGRFSLGMTWDGLFTLHWFYALFTTIGGIWLGYRQGKYWWRKIYEEGGLRRIKSFMNFMRQK